MKNIIKIMGFCFFVTNSNASLTNSNDNLTKENNYLNEVKLEQFIENKNQEEILEKKIIDSSNTNIKKDNENIDDYRNEIIDYKLRDYKNEMILGISGTKVHYQEFIKGEVLDGEYSDYEDMLGFNYSYSRKLSNDFKFLLDNQISFGSTDYKGQTWGGDKISFTQEKVKISNIQLGIQYQLFDNDLISIDLKNQLGYRNWYRGKSDYVGSYEELYKWIYLTFGADFNFHINSILNIGIGFDYNKALDASLETGIIGFEKTDLEVKGYNIHIPIEYKVKDNISFIAETTFENWEIEESESKILKVGNKNYNVFEPESSTNNTTISLKVKYMY